MCGVLAITNAHASKDDLRLKTLTLQRLVRHRGPDGSGIQVIDIPGKPGRCSSVAHERLAIVDPLSGNQPLFSHDRSLICSVNGEIYNYKTLAKELKDKTPFRTASDCEVIVHLYDEVGVDVASKLDGDFAFVIVDEKNGEVRSRSPHHASMSTIPQQRLCVCVCVFLPRFTLLVTRSV
jgi:asparagine synthase (glutamine-hydrolysing)